MGLEPDAPREGDAPLARGPSERADPGAGDDRERMIRAVESLLGYLTVVARALKTDDRAGLEHASDLVQKTVMTALGSIAKGAGPDEPDAKMKAWLRGIMVNLHRQSLRARPAGSIGEDEPCDSDLTPPSARASRDELARLMARARARLDERDRRVLDWKHDEKLTFEAIGERLGISAPAALKAHRRALERLEDAFLTVAAEGAYRRTRDWLRSMYRIEGPG